MAIKLDGSVEVKRIHEYLDKVLSSGDLANYYALIDSELDDQSYRYSLEALKTLFGNGSGGSTRVIYTSELGAVDDADISLGSTTFGTDNTTVLQNALDEAQTNPIILVVDGRYSHTGLIYYGNTHIIGLPGCGFILRNASNTYSLRNANVVFSADGSNIVDENVIFENIIINHNGYNTGPGGNSEGGFAQAYSLNVGCVGVRNLEIKNCKIYGSRATGVFIRNVEYVTLHTLEVDHGDVISQAGHTNGDGIRFNGYARFVDIASIVLRNCDDDLIALNADDAGTTPYGPITDVNIDNIVFEDCEVGVFRLLSYTNLIDRITVSNVKGESKGRLAIIGPHTGSGSGNVGDVTFENINVSMGGSSTLGYFHLDSVIKKLTLKNIYRDSMTAMPYIKTTAKCELDYLHVDGFISDTTGGTFSNPFIDIPAGRIIRAIISNYLHREITSDINSEIVKLTGVGNLAILIIDNMSAVRINSLVTNSNIINTILANNIEHFNSSGNAGFVNTGSAIVNMFLSNYTGTLALSGTFTNKDGDTLKHLGSYTVATLPSAAGVTGGTIFVSDESGGAVLAFSDGTNWRRVTDRAIVT